MVKNTNGGSKAKGQARKHVFVKTSQILRIAEDPLEIYVQVQKMLGGELCQVEDSTGHAYLCHIRGKFRGRGKRDNFIKVGTWCLVGCREWDMTHEQGQKQQKQQQKIPHCDLLEVYTDLDKDKLQSRVVGVEWSKFVSADEKKYHVAEHEMNQFEFVNETETTDFLAEMNKKDKLIEEKKLEKKDEDEDEDEDETINVDDI